MPDQDKDRLLDVIVAVYDTVDDAKADYELVKSLYRKLGTSDHFDAAVIEKTAKGRVRIVDTYEAKTRHEALRGLGFGLAAGVVAAAFPAIGIAAAIGAGGAGGSAIGAMVGHVQEGMPRDDLKKLGDLLYPAEAGFIAVYETSLADQIARNLKAANHAIGSVADMTADKIAEEVRMSAA
jgi:uncharacterized membrane protein